MVLQQTLPTFFAPPEMAGAASLAADRQRFERYALINELLSAVPEIFLVLNAQRQIIFANDAAVRLLGYGSLDDLVGLRPGNAVDCTHATLMPGGCGTSEFCRECGAVRAILSSLHGAEDVQECRIMRRDGDALDLRVQARPLTLDGNQYSLFAVVDISHEKRRRALERIFFHDILNTAGGMIGVADILRTGGIDEVSEFKDTIYVLATSLVDEIKSQQILSAAEAGELAVNPSRINTLTLLLELRNLYNNHEVSVGRRLEFSADSESIVFVSDGVLVRRVVGNMIKNALEACRTGQSVTVTSCLHQGNVEFRVHNPGSIPRISNCRFFSARFQPRETGVAWAHTA
ncbi:MAG: PAS domain-containing sensor histidine kinase [Anaerolineales bacterium]|nr:PAS domain-containing sensor histidine kinase [Anaerolineales bacterium]